MAVHEQGWGDTFQFCRYIPELRKQYNAERVIFSAPRGAMDLLKQAQLADEVIELMESPTGQVDYYCPLLTIPAYTHLTINTIDPTPYLAPLKNCKRMLQRNNKFKVGLVWAGRPLYSLDRWRSANLGELFPLFAAVDTDKIEFYSLQKDDNANQLRQSGLDTFVTDCQSMLGDWNDTAAIMNELDLLISVDTSPLHLAGAMGKRAIVICPQSSVLALV